MTIKLIANYRQENNGFFFLFAFCFFWVEDNLIFLKKSYSKLDVLNILSEGNTHQTTKTAETNWTDFYQFGNDIRYSRQGEQDSSVQFWYSVHVDLQPHCLSGLFFSNKLKRLTFLHDCMTDQSGRIINQKINILPNNNSLDFKNDPRPGCLPNDM